MLLLVGVRVGFLRLRGDAALAWLYSASAFSYFICSFSTCTAPFSCWSVRFTPTV